MEQPNAKRPGRCLELVTPLHTRTRRVYLPRMQDDKVEAMLVAKRFGPDYWDGARRYGYGGYVYDGRWAPVARRMIDLYGLGPAARILDIGCGKGFLLHELRRELPGATVCGLDISDYALARAKPEIRPWLIRARAGEPLPFADASFDLALSVGVLHNLPIGRLARALGEMERLGRHKYLMVESYRNEQELFNLQCWALTCQTFLDVESWSWLYGQAGYTGDFEYIFFE